MSSKSTTFKNELLKLIFQNTPMTLVGDASGILGSAVAGSLYIALHTSDPGVGGDQTTNEVVYTGYAREGVARSSAGWTVSAGEVVNADVVDFPQCSGGSAVATHFSIGVAGSGASKVLYRGELSPSIAISSGVTPSLAAGDIAGAED